MRAVHARFTTAWPMAYAGTFALAGSASLAYERARPLAEQGGWWVAGVVLAVGLALTAPIMAGAALCNANDESVDAGRVHAGLSAALLGVLALRTDAEASGFPDGFTMLALFAVHLAVLMTEVAFLNVASTRKGGRPAGDPFVFPGISLSLFAGFLLGSLA